MRNDIAHIFTSRAKCAGYEKKGRRRPIDDLPNRESMNPQRKNFHEKSCRDNSRPLMRVLMKNVDKSWNVIYSDIRHAAGNSELGEYFVRRLKRMVGKRDSWSRFFIDEQNILRLNKRRPKWRTRNEKKAYKLDGRFIVELHGLMYSVEEDPSNMYYGEYAKISSMTEVCLSLTALAKASSVKTLRFSQKERCISSVRGTCSKRDR